MKHCLSLALILTACGEGRAPLGVSQASLPQGVAARVGSQEIRSETLERIARAQGVPLALARERAIADALFASQVRSDPLRRADVSTAERAALARAVLDVLRARARALGPASDDEIATLTAARWVELDRPESVRTAHALVRVEKPEEDAPARALAEQLAVALRGASNGDELVRRAKAFPAGAQKIIAERLPPCTLDGRTWDPNSAPPAPIGGSFDPEFVRAAHALKNPGDQTGIVKTSFGYHVIELEQRYPEQRESLENRRAILADTVISRRAKPEYEALLARLRAATPVEVDRAADELTALVPAGLPPIAP